MKNHNIYILCSSYWLLRDWLKLTPKKDLDFVKMRTEDLLKTMETEIRDRWNSEANICFQKEFKPVSESCGTVMTVKDWLGCVENGGFIDYDGSGSLCRDGKWESETGISPSDITVFKVTIPEWATHVVWYNR